MPLTCLVTGSQGFLGKSFQKFHNFPFEKIIWGTTSARPHQSKAWRQFAPEYADIDAVLASEKVDVIIHFAAIIPRSFSEASFERHFLLNVQMMQHIARFSARHGIKKVVYISTFGSMRSPDQYDIQDYYTLGKITGEHICSIMEAQGIETASLRISSPYGEFNQSRTVLNLFLENALSGSPLQVYGTGSRSQNFLYAGDIVRAIECCVINSVSGVYPLLGETVTMKELAETVLKATHSNSKILIGEKPDPQEGQMPVKLYSSRMRDELGFIPQVSLTEGLNNTLNWLKGNRLEDRVDLRSACQQ